MLDLAHSIFNVVTGVSARDERHEIRAFRSVLEWRELIEKAGFVDSMLYELESGDPTLDEMMCFVKPPFDASTAPDAAEHEVNRDKQRRAAKLAGDGNLSATAIPSP